MEPTLVRLQPRPNPNLNYNPNPNHNSGLVVRSSGARLVVRVRVGARLEVRDRVGRGLRLGSGSGRGLWVQRLDPKTTRVRLGFGLS